MNTTSTLDINGAFSQYEEWLTQGNEKAQEIISECEKETVSSE